MRLLILTQYFPPEIGAPQNRLFELAVLLRKKGHEVTILTAMPNYPHMKVHAEYQNKFYLLEEREGLKIHRCWIFVSQSKSLLFRLLNYFSFVFSSLIVGLFKVEKADYILCESPPLFLGISAVVLKKVKNMKLIFNVSDLWPESAEKLGLVTNKTVLNMATALEEFLYKSSEFITGQTQGIVRNIASRFPDKKIHWLKNGVDISYYDPEKFNSEWRKENKFSQDDFLIIYAGILGYAQGLEVILKAASKLIQYQKIKFVIIGEGPLKNELMQMKENLKLDNVRFYNAVDKSKMPYVLKAIDVCVVPLKRNDLFKGAIPSKIFENLAMKNPVLLGVEGEAEELFIKQGKCGLSFIPEDAESLSKQILVMYNSPELMNEFSENARNYVTGNFDRKNIAADFELFLLQS